MNIKEFLNERGYSKEFNFAVCEELKEIPERISDKELNRRKDLTELLTVTIDGDDSKDLDDAVTIEQVNKNHYRLGVHIADVSYYVKEGSALDDEAMERGTSVYLGNNVVPMLPKKLSNDLCSLNPHKPRLALSVFMYINEAGGIEDYEICESVIKSNYRLTYKNVTKILDGDMALRNEYAEITEMLELMRKVALKLRDKRMRRGCIDFDFPETKIIEDENDNVINITKYDITVSNRIIEEFMLSANETVAKYMLEKNIPGVYRVHEPPEYEKIERLALLLRAMGYKFKMKENISPKALQNILFQINGKPEQPVLSTLMLRSMMKARYDSQNLGHFGLASEYYLHFTSPIRRYPDLAVHRILKDELNGKLNKTKIKKYEKFVKRASERSSDTEVNAVMAEREFNDIKSAEYMKNKIGMSFDGVISSVTDFGFFVQLDNTIEGLVRLGDLKDDYYEFFEPALTLIGRRSGIEYKIGDKIKVVLVKANPELKQIDFIPYSYLKEEKITGKSEKRGVNKSEGKSVVKQRKKGKSKPGKKNRRSK